MALTWYDGGKRPEGYEEAMRPGWRSGVLFVGEKGRLLADYERRLLLPEADFAAHAPPEPSIPDSIGHHAEWIQACKTGGKTTCSFDYSGPLTEAVLLGNVAYRAGKKLEWDAERQKARDCPDADRFIRKSYREGWSLSPRKAGTPSGRGRSSGSWTGGAHARRGLLSAASRPARASAMAEVVSSYRCGAAPELRLRAGAHRTSLLIHLCIVMKR